MRAGERQAQGCQGRQEQRQRHPARRHEDTRGSSGASVATPGEADRVATSTTPRGDVHGEHDGHERERGEEDRRGEAHASLRPSSRAHAPAVESVTCSAPDRRNVAATAARSSRTVLAKRSRSRRSVVSTSMRSPDSGVDHCHASNGGELALARVVDLHRHHRVPRVATLRLTKGRRSAYDQAMPGLHDAAKLDERYQADSPQVAVSFPPGTSWMCFTDQAMYAATSGRFAFEQTFYLPASAMVTPERTPLRQLEKIAGRAMV